MRAFLATSVATLALVFTASAAETPAPGPQVCDQRNIIVASLSEKYGEAAQSIGLDNGGNLLEIFASSAGSWTAILTNPRGQACIVAAGEAFEQVNLPPVI
jgi:hypothetical protein